MIDRLLRWAAAGLALYAAYATVRPLLVVMLLAAALASLTGFAYRRLLGLTRGRERLAAGLTVLGTLGLVLVPLIGVAVLVLQRLIVEATQLAHDLASGHSMLPRVLERLGPVRAPLELAFQRVQGSLSEAAPQLAQRAAKLAAHVGTGLMRGGIGLFLLGVALYYFLVDGERWLRRVTRLLPLQSGDVELFVRRFHQVSVGVLVGNLGTALAQGALATCGYMLFGAPLPLIWGLVTVVAALIPAVGTVLVWAPVALVVGLEHGWLRGLGLLSWGALLVSTIDNLVRPLLTRRGLQIHPLLIFVAVFGGVATWGVAGIFLGPLVISVAVTVLDLYEQRGPHGPPPPDLAPPTGITPSPTSA